MAIANPNAQYLAATSKQIAKGKSSDWWQNITGHVPGPDDATQFLCLVWVSQVDSSAMVEVMQRELDMVWPYLNASEQNLWNTYKLTATDPKVVAFFNQNPPPTTA
jgi:hypothetical protein